MKAQRAKQLSKIATILGKPVKDVKRMYRNGEIYSVMDNFEKDFKESMEFAKKFEVVEKPIDRIPVDDEQP